MTLHIKNMVCNRCIIVVEKTLKEIGLISFQVTMGLEKIEGSQLTNDKRNELIEKLTNPLP